MIVLLLQYHEIDTGISYFKIHVFETEYYSLIYKVNRFDNKLLVLIKDYLISKII